MSTLVKTGFQNAVGRKVGSIISVDTGGQSFLRPMKYLQWFSGTGGLQDSQLISVRFDQVGELEKALGPHCEGRVRA